MLRCYLELHQRRTSKSLSLALMNTDCILNTLLESQGSVIFDEECKDYKSSAQRKISRPYHQEVGYEESSSLFRCSERSSSIVLLMIFFLK